MALQDASNSRIEELNVNDFYACTNYKEDSSASTVYAYHSRGYARHEMSPIPMGKTVGQSGRAEGKPICKWWKSEPHVIKNVFEFDAFINSNRNKDIALCLDGPSDKVLDDTSTHRIIDDECHHVRRKAFSICDEPKYITFIDIDGVDCPAGIAPISPEAVEHCISQLPPPFDKATYHFQYSSSAGLAKKAGQISVHLTGFTDIPITNLQKKTWFEQNCKKIKIDLSIYDAVSLFYIREPKFIDGAIDPFIKAGISRTGIILGENFTVDAHEVASVVIEHTFTLSNHSQDNSRSYSLTNSFKLFDRDECYNSVMQITKNLVIKYGPLLDIAQAITSVQAEAQKAVKSGKLKMTSAREKTLSDNFIRQALEGAIKKGFSAQLVSVSGKNLSVNDRYEAALKASVSNDRRQQDLAYTALYHGQSLIGVRFSADELIEEVFRAHVVGSETEAGIKAHFYARLAYQKQELMYSLDLSDTIDNTVENIEIIKINYLSEVKVNKNNVTLLKAGMGVGKTKKTGASECKSVNNNAMAVSNRVTLAGALSNVLGLKLYTDKTDSTLQGYAGCINSIYKERNMKPALFLVDEFSQVLESVMMSSRMRNRHGVYMAFAERINSTDKVLGMDAGLCDRDIVALRRMTDKKIIIYVIPEKDEGMKVTLISAEKNPEYIPAQMAIADNEPFVLCSDSKKLINTVHEQLKTEGLKGLCITSEKRHPEAVSDMNAYINKHKPDYLIFSPAISSGISITAPHFKNSYGIYHGNIPPADMLQMIKRVRTIKEITMVVTKGRSGARADIKAKKNGLKQVSKVSDTRFGRDKLSQECLEFEKHASLQMSAAAICLYELMKLKNWTVAFHRTSKVSDKFSTDMNTIKRELKEKFISEVIKAKLVGYFELEYLSKEDGITEQEQLQVVKGFMCKQAGKDTLKEEDVKYLCRFGEGFKELERILGGKPDIESKEHDYHKKSLGIHTSIVEVKFHKTTYKLRNKLLKVAGIELIAKMQKALRDNLLGVQPHNSPLIIDVESLAKAIRKHKPKCLALGLLKHIAKKDEPQKITKTFFARMGLNQRKVRGKNQYHIDADLLQLAFSYITNKKGFNQVDAPRIIINKGKRFNQLSELIVKNKFAILTPAWIVNNVETITTVKSAEKWITDIKKNPYGKFYEYPINIRYNGGRFTKKVVITNFDEKPDLIEYFAKQGEIETK